MDTTKHELLSETLNNERLFNIIQRIRYKENDCLESISEIDIKSMVRRLDIQENMIGFSELEELVIKGETEKNLQKLIKKDLSLVGEVYSDMPDEYICFSEFPIDTGFVDFVVFSGRSRLEVTLIEIKGANFNLINKNQYNDFSAKLNQAAKQIRDRFGYIVRNYSEFRKKVHVIRSNAEAGENKYNAFRGPYWELKVDPNKDIIISAVIIAGRGKNDIHESRLRHDYEHNSKFPMKVESWDSWLKKLSRK